MQGQRLDQAPLHSSCDMDSNETRQMSITALQLFTDVFEKKTQCKTVHLAADGRSCYLEKTKYI